MTLDDTVSNIYELVSNSLLLYFITFFVLLTIFISLDVLNVVLPDEEYLLKYGDLLSGFILMIITAVYTYDNNRMIKLSKNTQEVMYTQTRLEKLYYPLKSFLNVYQIDDSNVPSKKWILMFKQDLNLIMPYFYLSSDKLHPFLINFMEIFYKNGVRIAKIADSQFEEKKQDETLSEEDTKNLALYQVVAKAIPKSAWEIPTLSEVKIASDLYNEIVSIVDNDILYYQTQLNKKTTTEEQKIKG